MQVFFACSMIVALLLFARAEVAPPPDPAQSNIDRFLDLIADGMWVNGRITTVNAKPDATDAILIASALDQLNKRPAPVKSWHILKSELVGQSDFDAHIHRLHPNWGAGINNGKYLIAVVDSDQGLKIIAISETHVFNGQRWARMYNCDAVFSSPQDGGTPLIR